jgi:hypothetical protein
MHPSIKDRFFGMLIATTKELLLVGGEDADGDAFMDIWESDDQLAWSKWRAVTAWPGMETVDSGWVWMEESRFSGTVTADDQIFLVNTEGLWLSLPGLQDSLAMNNFFLGVQVPVALSDVRPSVVGFSPRAIPLPTGNTRATLGFSEPVQAGTGCITVGRLFCDLGRGVCGYSCGASGVGTAAVSGAFVDLLLPPVVFNVSLVVVEVPSSAVQDMAGFALSAAASFNITVGIESASPNRTNRTGSSANGSTEIASGAWSTLVLRFAEAVKAGAGSVSLSLRLRMQSHWRTVRS